MEVYVRGAEVASVIVGPPDKYFVEAALHAALNDMQQEARLLLVRYGFAEGKLHHHRLRVCSEMITRVTFLNDPLTLHEEEARATYEGVKRGLRALSQMPYGQFDATEAYRHVRFHNMR